MIPKEALSRDGAAWCWRCKDAELGRFANEGRYAADPGLIVPQHYVRVQSADGVYWEETYARRRRRVRGDDPARRGRDLRKVDLGPSSRPLIDMQITLGSAGRPEVPKVSEPKFVVEQIVTLPTMVRCPKCRWLALVTRGLAAQR